MHSVTATTDVADLFAPTPASSTGFTSRDALQLLFKHGRIIAGCMAAVTALVWAGASVQPATYASSAKLWVKTEQQSAPAFLTGLTPNRDVSAPDPSNRKIETEMELLLSRDNAERVIAELGVRPEQLIRSPIQVIQDRLPKLPGLPQKEPTEKSRQAAHQALVDAFIKSFKLEALRSKSADTTSNVLEIQFTAADPELVPKAINSMMKAYLEVSSLQNRQLGEKTFALLEAKAEEARRDLASSEQALVGFMAKNGDRTSRQAVGGTGGGSPAVATMKSQSADLQAKLDDLRQIYTEEAQNVRALDQSITALQQRMRTEVRANAEADAELSRLERQRNLAQDRFVELRRRLDQIDLYLKVNPSEAESRVVTQSADVPTAPDNKKRQIAFLMAPVGGLLLGLALAAMRQMSDRRIETPEELRRALGIEVLAAVPDLSAEGPVAHQLDAADAAGNPLTVDPTSTQSRSAPVESSDGVTLLPDAEELQRHLDAVENARRRAIDGAPLVGTVQAHTEPALRTVRANDRGLLMHRLALRVREQLPDRGLGRVLVVSSSRPDEGKSVIARALAKRLVQQHRGRVLLIDGSAEDPAGHAGSRAKSRPGFYDLLREPKAHASAVVSRSDARLHLLAAGPHRDASLVYHESTVRDLFAKLRERYHWTVVDAGALPQIGSLGHQADGVLLVVDASSTRREVVKGAIDGARLPAGKLLGAVLNRRPQYVPAWAYRHWL